MILYSCRLRKPTLEAGEKNTTVLRPSAARPHKPGTVSRMRRRDATRWLSYSRLFAMSFAAHLPRILSQFNFFNVVFRLVCCLSFHQTTFAFINILFCALMNGLTKLRIFWNWVRFIRVYLKNSPSSRVISRNKCRYSPFSRLGRFIGLW